MAKTPSFLEDPQGTRGAIMKATYHALCEHGYADLTIRRISDHFEKSKSLLYYHYDSKDGLLLDFLEYMLEEFEQSVPAKEQQGDGERLDAILDRILTDTLLEGRQDFMRAMVELRSQAAHDERYRDHFTRSDQFFQTRLADAIQAGIDEDAFHPVDPDCVAAFLLTVINGAMTQRVTTETNTTAAVREELSTYIETTLLADGADA